MDNDLHLYKRAKPGCKNPLKGLPAVYLILEVKSDKVYVGSTNDLSRRQSENINDLKNNSHKNHNLQKLYNENGEFVILYNSCDNVEQARIIEQKVVDALKDTGKLLNIATENVLLSTLGRKITDDHRKSLLESNRNRIISNSTKEKMSLAKKNYDSTDEGKLKLKRMVEKISIPIIYNGVKYNSISEASRILNLPWNHISKYSKRQL